MESRRGFLFHWWRNLPAMAGELCGKRAISPRDLQGWSETRLGRLRPLMGPPQSWQLQGGTIFKCDAEARTVVGQVDLLEQQLISSFDGGSSLTEIAGRLAEQEERPEAEVFACARQLFLTLAEAWICRPAELGPDVLEGDEPSR